VKSSLVTLSALRLHSLDDFSL